jgi:hypothetical protein
VFERGSRLLDDLSTNDLETSVAERGQVCGGGKLFGRIRHVLSLPLDTRIAVAR